MTPQMTFHRALTKRLFENVSVSYGLDNWDVAISGKLRYPELSRKRIMFDRMLLWISPFLRRHGYGVTPLDNLASEFDNMMELYGEGLSETYALLADDRSRVVMIDVLAYRLLGYRRMKLPTNTTDYWRRRTLAESLPSTKRELASILTTLPVTEIDLRPIGYPMTILATPPVIESQFLRTDYAYNHSNPPIWIGDGQYVIDGGASWGDTALRFAHEVGTRGRVFSFEFDPQSLAILDRNLELNPSLASRICVVRKALWSDSATTLAFIPNGPSTKVSEVTKDPRGERVLCVSIDDFSESMPRVDFIKMDIEGAELTALRGAERTLRNYRPKLAICVYHNLSDLIDVPAYLVSLGLEYDCYLGHSTIQTEETVLFAVSRQART